MNPNPWTIEQTETLVRMALEGATGAQIAVVVGRSRNAVMGYCHRNGISLAIGPEKQQEIVARRTAALEAARAAQREHGPSPRFPDGHAVFRSRPRGARAFTDVQIATAIAAHLAGMSMNKAAGSIGASPQSLKRNWMADPALMSLGRSLYERAKADAAERAAARARLQALHDGAERVRVETINAAFWPKMSERHRQILKGRLAGETLQTLGDRFGVTRERIRQIEVAWRVRGFEMPDARPLADLALSCVYVPSGRAGTSADGRRRDNLRPEIRQARSERMRAVWSAQRQGSA